VNSYNVALMDAPEEVHNIDNYGHSCLLFFKIMITQYLGGRQKQESFDRKVISTAFDRQQHKCQNCQDLSNP
jgi:hypothetical protein